MEDLIPLIEERAAPALFVQSPALTAQGIAPPTGAMLWVSPYAQLVLWPTTSSDTIGFRKDVEIAEAWVDVTLQLAEEKLASSGTSLDGYLVIALSKAPSESLQAQIRQLELSPHTCRKNVVWPDKGGNYVQLDRIAILSPRAFVESDDTADWPELDGSEKKLLERFLNEGGPLPVANADQKDAGSE